MDEKLVRLTEKSFWEPEAEQHLHGLIYFTSECCTDEFRLNPELPNHELGFVLEELSENVFFDPMYLYMDAENILCRRILEQIDKAFKQLGDYNDFDAWEVKKALADAIPPKITSRIVSGPDYWNPEV